MDKDEILGCICFILFGWLEYEAFMVGYMFPLCFETIGLGSVTSGIFGAISLFPISAILALTVWYRGHYKLHGRIIRPQPIRPQPFMPRGSHSIRYK